MQMLRNFGANKTYILFFLAPPLPPTLSKNSFRATGKADNYQHYKLIQHLKKLEYCSQHNMLA